MRPFSYERASDAAQAVRAGAGPVDVPPTSAPTQFIAGGTVMLDLMKLDTMRPERLVDIRDLERDHRYIRVSPDGLQIGALVTMAELGDHPDVRRDYPVIAQTMHLAASAQIRNMATLGGNVLQRSRCNYFRNSDWRQCNKREPGSGCAAIGGINRKHAVLGVNDLCISAYPGDFAQALVALDAQVELLGAHGPRRIRFEDLHTGPERPDLETVLAPGELITGFIVPSGPWTRRSLYTKVRDRESYEYAVASAAVALDLDGDSVRSVRIGLGGLAYKPWRAHEAEAALIGKPLTEGAAQAAASAAFADARTDGENAFKPELGRRTLVRALLDVKRLEI